MTGSIFKKNNSSSASKFDSLTRESLLFVHLFSYNVFSARIFILSSELFSSKFKHLSIMGHTCTSRKSGCLCSTCWSAGHVAELNILLFVSHFVGFLCRIRSYYLKHILSGRPIEPLIHYCCKIRNLKIN